MGFTEFREIEPHKIKRFCGGPKTKAPKILLEFLGNPGNKISEPLPKPPLREGEECIILVRGGSEF